MASDALPKVGDRVFAPIWESAGTVKMVLTVSQLIQVVWM